MAQENTFKFWKWELGKPAELMSGRYIETLSSVVEQWRRVDQKDLRGYMAGSFAAGAGALEAIEAPTEGAARIFWPWPPFPGGIRIPHVHFGGEVYLPTEKQWQSFTTEVIGGFQEKLANAKTISVRDLNRLSEAIDNLG